MFDNNAGLKTEKEEHFRCAISCRTAAMTDEVQDQNSSSVLRIDLLRAIGEEPDVVILNLALSVRYFFFQNCYPYITVLFEMPRK